MKRMGTFLTVIILMTAGIFLMVDTNEVSSFTIDDRWAGSEGRTVVCNASYAQEYMCSISDGEGGLYVAWQDMRSDDYEDVYVQHLSSEGTPLWTENGIYLTNETESQIEPELVSDGSGGVIVLWSGSTLAGYDIYGQRLDSIGSLLWGSTPKTIVVEISSQRYINAIPDNEGGAILTWGDTRDGGYDVYAQRIDPNGDSLWTENGIVVCNATGDQARPYIVTDGEGGAIIAWADRRGADFDIYAQKVDSSGNMIWERNGMVVSAESGRQNDPHIISDDEGGAVIVWEDERNDFGDIYAQRVNGSGIALWTAGGIEITGATGQQKAARVEKTQNGNFIFAWEDDRGVDRDIYAQSVDTDGDILWNGMDVSICSQASIQLDLDMIPDLNGGAYLSWSDHRSKSSYKVYIQHLAGNGSVYWQEDGILLTDEEGTQKEPQLVEDGKGGALIVYYNDSYETDIDIYASHIGMRITTDGPPGMVNEDNEYSFDMGSTEDENTTWSIRSDLDILSIDPSTGVISGTPDNSHVGEHWVEVRAVTHEGNWDILNYTLTVMNVPLEITTLDPVTSIDQDENYLFDLNSTDDGQGLITWSMTTNVTWLSINTTSGMLSGMPTNDDVGEWTVNVTANDGNGGSDLLSFNVTVIDVNDFPIIENAGSYNATEDEYFSIVIEWIDVDVPADELIWNITTSSPWMVVNLTSLEITGTPLNDDVGENWVLVHVNDGRGGDDELNITISVSNVNDLPEILTEMLEDANQDQVYQFELSAIDIDPTGDNLTWAITSNAEWLSINSTTGVLSGTPGMDDVGTVDVVIIVDDGIGENVSVTLTLEVLGINIAPTIDDVIPVEGVSGEQYEMVLTASDADGDVLIWSMVTDASWMEINSTSGTISGIAMEGTFEVNVTVDDGRGGTDSVSFTVEVGSGTADDDDDTADDDDTDDDDDTADDDDSSDNEGSFVPFVILGLVLALIVIGIIALLVKRSGSGDISEE